MSLLDGPVLVTGAGGPAGRSVAAQLRERGVRVLGVDLAPPPADPEILPVPAATAPGFVAALHQLAEEHRAALIVPTVSEELPVLAPYADGPVPIVVGSVAAAALAHDKWWTARALDASGVAVPRYAGVRAGADVTVLGEQLGWPFVTKPRVGRGGRGVVVHRPGKTGSRVPAGPSLIAQEFAPGTEYAVNIYRPWSTGRTRVVVLRKATRTHGEIGNATTVERIEAPDAAEVAVAAVHALELRGPVDLDVRRRADGTPVVLEVNARFGAHSAAAPELLHGLLEERGLLAAVTA